MLLMTALSLAGAGASFQASAIESPRFASRQQVQGNTLVLNGQGIRYRFLTKVYGVALYIPKRVQSLEEMLALSGPKRLNFVALHDVSGTDLGLSFFKALVANSPPETVQRNVAFTTRMIDIFSARTKLFAGDRYAIEYVPGQGTTFYLDDKPQGGPIGGDEFFEMVVRIWLGPAPVDFKLKDALMGV